MNKLLVIVFARFGPYHVARLRAATSKFKKHGWDILGLEISSTDKAHYWERVGHQDDYEIVTLENNRDYSSLTVSHINKIVTKELNARQPLVVAVNGWQFAEARSSMAWVLNNRAASILMSTSQHNDYPRKWWGEFVKKK